MKCPYCHKPAELLDSMDYDFVECSEDSILPRNFEVALTKHRRIWACMDCDAFVPCKPNSTKPAGTLANLALRRLRVRAHEAFDPLWQQKLFRNRKQAYFWLSQRLQVPLRDCHISNFNEEQCKTVIQEASSYYWTKRASGLSSVYEQLILKQRKS